MENLLAEIQVSYNTNSSVKPKIVTSQNAYEILLASWFTGTLELQEEFKVLLLNRASLVICKHFISKGGQAGTVVDPKIIFKIALEHNAAYIILAHNHPSGNLKPSTEDISITKKLKESGLLLEIPIFDHLIITDHTYLSFADEGLM